MRVAIALILSGFPCFIAVNAMSSMAMVHSIVCVRMFLKPLTLWFSRLKYCLSLEMALSAEAL